MSPEEAIEHGGLGLRGLGPRPHREKATSGRKDARREDAVTLTHEYMKHRSGYSLAAGACWIRVYSGPQEGDAPVVVIETLPGVDRSGETVSQVAAEVMREHFGRDEGSVHRRPVIWIEKTRNRHYLLTFPQRLPVPASMGFTARYTLGPPQREPLTEDEVAALLGRNAWT